MIKAIIFKLTTITKIQRKRKFTSLKLEILSKGVTMKVVDGETDIRMYTNPIGYTSEYFVRSTLRGRIKDNNTIDKGTFVLLQKTKGDMNRYILLQGRPLSKNEVEDIKLLEEIKTILKRTK